MVMLAEVIQVHKRRIVYVWLWRCSLYTCFRLVYLVTGNGLCDLAVSDGLSVIFYPSV
jgi:hypothetical protein